MRFRFEMPGETYSKNKESFKRILAKHGLRWRGSLDRPVLATGGDRLGRDLRMNLEGIVAVETISLAAVIWEKRDPDVTLPTPRLAVPAFGDSTQIRMNLP